MTYERYVFHMRKQEESESVEAFISVLRNLIKTCKYCNNCVNSILRDQIVLGIKDTKTQSDLLKERNLTLQECIDMCKLSENAVQHSKVLRPDTVVNKVSTAAYQQKSRTQRQSSKDKKECRFLY